MLYVLSDSFDPFYNLATEEFLLKHKSDNVIMLWRSDSAIIVGKHQNALAEVNYEYILEKNITVARRLSGGGTVVHDLQNLNFTFITNGEDGKLIDFKRYLKPIIEYLTTLGIEAKIGKTNDLRIGELKISGNAEHVFRKRVLHHGTLLFNSDLNRLRKAIDTKPGKYTDKAVQSNRASVTNIASHLKTPLSIEEFTKTLSRFLQDKYPGDTYHLSPNEHQVIQELIDEKYSLDKWIWGYSPKYTFKNQFDFQNNHWNIEIVVSKGLVAKAVINRNNQPLHYLEIALRGRFHLYNSFAPILSSELNLPLGEDLNIFTLHYFK